MRKSQSQPGPSATWKQDRSQTIRNPNFTFTHEDRFGETGPRLQGSTRRSTSFRSGLGDSSSAALELRMNRPGPEYLPVRPRSEFGDGPSYTFASREAVPRTPTRADKHVGPGSYLPDRYASDGISRQVLAHKRSFPIFSINKPVGPKYKRGTASWADDNREAVAKSPFFAKDGALGRQVNARKATEPRIVVHPQGKEDRFGEVPVPASKRPSTAVNPSHSQWDTELGPRPRSVFDGGKRVGGKASFGGNASSAGRDVVSVTSPGPGAHKHDAFGYGRGPDGGELSLSSKKPLLLSQHASSPSITMASKLPNFQGRVDATPGAGTYFSGLFDRFD